MKLSSRYLLTAVLLASIVPAIAVAGPESTVALDGYSLGAFNGTEPGAVRVNASFPEDAQSRASGSLYGATTNWERDQRAAWGAGIPGLTVDEGRGGCGPIAAEALVRFFAGDPKLDKIREIFSLAENKGYWDGAMKGAGSEQSLLSDLGIQTELKWGGTEQMIRESLDKGKPVLISTVQHYFLAEGYNNNGKLFVGYTGLVKRCGAAQMTLSEISSCGGGEVVLIIPR